MSKYLYPIYKLKIKSYIRWWLYNYLGKFNNYVLSEILTGLSFYLENSIDRKFNVFDIIGRTTQDGDPTPKNLVPIKNTGDNGFINEKLQNKNLWNGDNININQTYTQNSSIRLGYFEGKAGTYTISLTEKLSNGCYIYVGANGSIIPSMDKKATFTLAKSGRYVVWIVIRAGTYTNFVSNIQIEQGSTETGYVSHSEQNLLFPLSQGQKLMQGDYLTDDRVHHKRIQIVLDGSNDEVFDKRSDTNEIRYYLPVNMKLNGEIICNYFMQRQSSSDKNYVRAVATEPVNTIMFKSELLNTDEMTIAEWREWLSTHNLIVEYELAEEQTEDFTEEQKTAWEQIKALQTYKNVTHISSEDETPAELKIQYWKEV